MCEKVVGESVLDVTLETMKGAVNISKRNTVDPTFHDGMIGLTCLTDMGWQKCASGRIYNSSTSNQMIFCADTKLILDCEIKNNKCTVCNKIIVLEQDDEKHKNTIERLQTHYCTKHWEGSSKLMEDGAAITLVKRQPHENNFLSHGLSLMMTAL